MGSMVINPYRPRYNAYTGAFTGTHDPREQMVQNRMKFAGMGDALAAQTGEATDEFGNLREGYRRQADTAYGELRDQPGYNPEEARRIGVDYSQFRTDPASMQDRYLTEDEQAGIRGNPQLQREALDPGYLEDINRGSAGTQRDIVGGLQTNLKSAYDPDKLRQSKGYVDTTRGALEAEKEGAGSALTSEEAKLEAANDPSKLGLSGDFINRYRMSDKDVQDLETQAGTTVGNRYKTAEDTLHREAAAEGNTSPAALAAARSRLLNQEAADEGTAVTNARIAAKGVQAGREHDIEGMRLGSEEDIASRRAGAATTLGQQRLAAAEAQAGRQLTAAERSEILRTAGEQDVANRNTEAAVIGGQTALNTEREIGRTAQDTARYNQSARVGVEKDIDAAQAERERAIAGNRQATNKDIGDTQYKQGVETAGATAGGARDIGQTRIGGEQSYRNYVTGQQQQAQQGQLSSTGQQIGAYGTQGGLINTSTGQKGSQDIAQSGANRGWALGLAGIGAQFLEDGDVVDEPGIYTIGEHGPEAVVPMGPKANGTFTSPESDRVMANDDQTAAGGSRRGPNFLQRIGAGIQRYRNAIGKVPTMMAEGGIVDKPTTVMLGEDGPEAVVPLHGDSGSKLTAGMFESMRKPNRYRTADCRYA